MNLNADFDKRAVVHSEAIDWIASPIPGVDRRMLDRIGDEVARATSIVRYAPNSHFSPHVHTGGEEFLVLDGVFEDEHGVFSAGSYIRNPPESSHTPESTPGCVIFVKLWQFDLQDRTHIRTDTNTLNYIPLPGRNGVEAAPLYQDEREDVRVERWASNREITFMPSNGLEVLVLDGQFQEGGETFEKGSWLRLPIAAELRVLTGSNGARVWVKEGHLQHVFDNLPS